MKHPRPDGILEISKRHFESQQRNGIVALIFISFHHHQSAYPTTRTTPVVSALVVVVDKTTGNA